MKTIGIPMMNQGENSVGLTKPYLEYFKQYGQVILLAPNTFLPDIDLLVLPGGKDIAGGNPDDFSFFNTDNERFLEFFDRYTLPQYIDARTPIYGICRGMQTIMRHFEIPLIQNIWWDHGYSKDEAETTKNVLTYLKYKDGHKSPFGVNSVGSWHHQGVSLATMKLQEEFDVIAYCAHKSGDDYSIVEFAEHRTLPIIVEQSHPERNNNSFEDFLIERLLNRAEVEA